PGGGILQRGHDADAALMAGADEMQKVLAKSRLILGVSGVVEKNADLVEVEPPGVVHVALGLSRVVGQPVFRMADGGCGLVVEPAHLRQVLRDVPFLRRSVGPEDREAGCKNENRLNLKTPHLGLDPSRPEFPFGTPGSHSVYTQAVSFDPVACRSWTRGEECPLERGYGSLKGYATASGPLPADCGRRVARI